MATTKTTRLQLAKQGLSDTGWHTDLNAGFDDADDRLLQEGAGTPVGSITPDFESQYYRDQTADVLWIATGAVNTDWKRVDEAILDTEANIGAMDAEEFAHILAYATDTDTLWLAWDDGGYSWNELLTTAAKDYTSTSVATSSEQKVGTTYEAVDGLTVTVASPDDAYDYEFDVIVTMAFGHVQDSTLVFRLQETEDYLGGGEATNDAVDTQQARIQSVVPSHTEVIYSESNVSLRYIQTSPDPGVDYRYYIEAKASSGDAHINPLTAFDSDQTWSRIWVRIRRRVAP